MIKPERLNPNCDDSSLELLRAAITRLGGLSEQAWADARARFFEYRLDVEEFFLQAGDIPQFGGFVVTGVLVDANTPRTRKKGIPIPYSFIPWNQPDIAQPYSPPFG